MLIELIGYPGAGKTTLARQFEQKMFGTNVVLAPPDIARRCSASRLIAWCKTPLFSGCLLLCLVFSHGVARANFDRIHRVQKSYIHLKSAKHQDIVLVDEGAIHSLFSCLYGTRQSRCANVFLRQLVNMITLKVDLFVQLSVSKEEAVASIRSRDHKESRFSRTIKPEDAKKFLQDRTYTNILEHLTERKVRIISGADDLRALLQLQPC